MEINFSNMVTKAEDSLIQALLPGLGYFGHTPETALVISINAEIDRLELAIEAPDLEIMNISAIDFFDQAGDIIPRKDIAVSVLMSTSINEEDCDAIFNAFCEGRLLHTKREDRPCINVELKKPIKISHISIRNRSDQYGARSRFLVANAFLDGDNVVKYKNMSGEIARSRLNNILKFTGQEIKDFSDKQDFIEFVVSARSRILTRLEKVERTFELKEICELLPLYANSVSIGSYHIRLCAVAVMDAWKGRKVVETSFLKRFGAVLSSDFSVFQLKTCIEQLIEKRQKRIASVVISRHHIHESRLLDQKENFLVAIDRIISILEPAGIQVMLGYGTLLGAVRDGQFMAHDDDVDLIVFDGSKSQADAEAGKGRIVELLKANGENARDLGFWHLHSVANGMTVDLFPTWQEGDEFFITMQQLKIRPVPVKKMLPVTKVKLYDRSYPAPADCASFLEDRYGVGWNVPDPYYEWPWKVDRIISGLPPNIARAKEKRKLISRKHFGRLCRVAWGQRVKRGDVSPPMNSLPIIDVAIEVGYDAVELDVSVTADDVLVLAHHDLLHGPDGSIDVRKTVVDDITKFKLGEFNSEDVYAPLLVDALRRAKDIDVQIDARVNASQVSILRRTVEEAKFDPTRLQFYVYNVAHAQALLQYFPESVLMWKTYRSFTEVDDYFLDEAYALGMDGIMISVPRDYEGYAEFMAKLRERGLRVLMFIHSGDEKKLKRMIENGVDYVTTLAHTSELFKKIGANA